MTKKVIRLAESDLHRIVSASVKRILNEGLFRDDKITQLIDEYEKMKGESVQWREICDIKKDGKKSLSILAELIRRLEHIKELIGSIENDKRFSLAPYFTSNYKLILLRLKNCVKALATIKGVVSNKNYYGAPSYLSYIVDSLSENLYRPIVYTA